MRHVRVRIEGSEVRQVPLDYTTYKGSDGWTDVRILEIPRGAVLNSKYVYRQGTDPSQEISQTNTPSVSFNASYASSTVLGYTVAGGKVIAQDIPGKTEHREHLWFDGVNFRIGRASADVEWAAQGGPVLRRDGRDVLAQQVQTEQIPSDIANGRNPRTMAGLKDDGTLVLVFVDGRARSDAGMTLQHAGILFDWLGCRDAINLDGGGSSIIATNIPQVQNLLNMGDYHVCDLSANGTPRVVHHAIVIDLDVEELMKERRNVSLLDEYRITSGYGWRKDPFTGAQSFHTGIDLVKKHDAPIYAFVPGVVIHARLGATGSGFGGYGNVVAIRDKYNRLHCYCHLNSYIVKEGQEVQKGQMIGRQGNTGRSTGSHLHYEIRKTYQPQFGWIADRVNNCLDPLQYLKEFEEKEKQLQKERQEQMAQTKNATLHKATLLLDGVKHEAFILDGRTYVPVRFILENLGVPFKWDGTTRTVIINTKGGE